ncbi:hypothetical protein ACRALDRAFT_1077883 [Sodiomyces alcalophilus JCM 7366]|uniref:uncharacterized protein n=1 Tax=Sodiomyces alcalophilus JCM 7366 TaxID=591952 RepID=UPI0039B61FAB
MLSYAIAFIAFILFFSNPIIKLFAPTSSLHSSRSPRPQLNESLLALPSPNDTALSCNADAYSVHILSSAPLVLYIENFLTQDERSHLLDISEPLYEPATVTNDGGATTHRDVTVRLSSVALIPRTDPVRCIEARARALQGWRPDRWLERLRTQRYDAPGGHYAHHLDWSSNAGGWGRVGSMMVWVHGDGSAEGEGEGERLEGGGTEFPLLRLKGDGAQWCRFVECREDVHEDAEQQQQQQNGRQQDESPDGGRMGVIFKPRPGNAVYWENFRPDGSGYDEAWHAGLPVTKGVKVGLNIWTWGRID